ncbi:glycosyltransferase family 2 protein [Chryseobacterium sp. A321]
MSEKISGLIITFNEEDNIKEVLNSFDLCDEILVIDSFSSDKTVQFAKEHPKTRVISHCFQDFSSQRNFALSEAKHDWVLFLDADERIAPNLRAEILDTLQSPNRKDAYYFYRLFFFENKPIRYSGTQKDKNFRLFRKSKCHYISEKLVHETLHVEGEIGVLRNKLLHYSVRDLKSYKAKMAHYGQLKGKELFQKQKRYNPFTQGIKTAFRFFKTYVLKLGFLDGKIGLKIAQLQSKYVYQTYDALREEWKNKK